MNLLVDEHKHESRSFNEVVSTREAVNYDRSMLWQIIRIQARIHESQLEDD